MCIRDRNGDCVVDAIAIPSDAIARAVAFAVEQPRGVDVNSIVVRPTAQS